MLSLIWSMVVLVVLIAVIVKLAGDPHEEDYGFYLSEEEKTKKERDSWT